MIQNRNIGLLLISLFVLTSLNLKAQKAKRIEILNANSIEFSEEIGRDIKRLLGDVQFKHENAIMYCDSAYLNSKTNYLQAFNNVHIVQADSLDLYGDYLNYNGNTKFAEVRQNVRLVHGASTLKTDSLDYDRVTNIAHYYSWGYLNDQENDLESVQGYYYTDLKDYYAVDSVTLTNPDYKIFSDSLRYNTGNDIAYFYGPTDIVSDSNYIYCEFGWYNTKTDIAEVSENAYILSKEKKLNGDSIYYDRNIGFGSAKNNVAILDTSAQILFTGHYANYFEHKDSAYVTEQALMTKYGDGDSLFLHADTLRIYTVFDTIWTESFVYEDSLWSDTSMTSMDEANESDSLIIHKLDTNLFYTVSPNFIDYQDLFLMGQHQYASTKIIKDTILTISFDTIRQVTAFNHAQIYKDDLQARSDSITYNTRDSILRLYHFPIIWSEDQQITAEYIEVLTENNSPTEMYMKTSAFIALKDDSIRFNQIEGVDMRAFFNDNQELYRLNVYQKAKSVFFPREEATEEQKRDSIKGDLVGANVTESRQMVIWFKDNQPNKITLLSEPKGVLSPKEYKPIGELMLKGFSWKDNIRPKSKADIFIWKEDDALPSVETANEPKSKK